MTKFLGTFADLTDYRLGDFRVESFLGRDANGFPRWKVACGKCGTVQVLSHTKLAPLIEAKAPQNLQCSNGECPASRTCRCPVSLADIKREEREQAAQTAHDQAKAKLIAAEQARKQAGIAALKNEYRTYYVHQLGTKIADSDIVSFARWQQLRPETRRMVLDTLKADSGAYFRGL